MTVIKLVTTSLPNVHFLRVRFTYVPRFISVHTTIEILQHHRILQLFFVAFVGLPDCSKASIFPAFKLDSL